MHFVRGWYLLCWKKKHHKCILELHCRFKSTLHYLISRIFTLHISDRKWNKISLPDLYLKREQKCLIRPACNPNLLIYLKTIAICIFFITLYIYNRLWFRKKMVLFAKILYFCAVLILRLHQINVIIASSFIRYL